MPDLILWKERQLKKMRQEMDGLVDRLCRDFANPAFSRTLQPDFDIIEEKDTIIVQGRLTDFDPDELQVAVSAEYLQIKGAQQKKIDWQNGEFSHSGSFSTKIRLPARIDPDQTKGSYLHHILKVTMVKCESGVMKQIDIDTK